MSGLTPETLPPLATTDVSRCTRESLSLNTIPCKDCGMMSDEYSRQEWWFGITDPAVVEEKLRELIEGE